jgi:hypothetical protein
MAKPVVIAKRPGPEWVIFYDDNDRQEASTCTVLGSPTIDDAIEEARTSLNEKGTDWYTITSVALVREAKLDSDQT